MCVLALTGAHVHISIIIITWYTFALNVSFFVCSIPRVFQKHSEIIKFIRYFKEVKEIRDFTVVNIRNEISPNMTWGRLVGG